MEFTYLGIDPGMSGACVAITGDTVLINTKATLPDVQWEWIAQFIGTNCQAAIEQQSARPTRFKKKGSNEFTETVLASTVTLYGSYRDLRTMLLCAAIPFRDIPPKRWQRGVGISPRKKEERQVQWKIRLKELAQKEFPQLKVTLANADALLIALYAKKKLNPLLFPDMSMVE